jgi:hypothetical protein
MYLLIRASMVFGIFSNKKYMKNAIEQYIKDNKETNGTPCGDFHFKYIKFDINDPWFNKDGEYHPEVGNALFSLSTMHDECFPNKVETDWSTGKIIKI